MITKMSRKQFLNEFVTLLDEDETKVQFDTKLTDLENWDSINMMSFFVFVDHEFDCSLDPDDIDKCERVDDLAQLLAPYLE